VEVEVEVVAKAVMRGGMIAAPRARPVRLVVMGRQALGEAETVVRAAGVDLERTEVAEEMVVLQLAGVEMEVAAAMEAKVAAVAAGVVTVALA